MQNVPAQVVLLPFPTPGLANREKGEMGMRKMPRLSTLHNTSCKVDTCFLSQQMQQQTHAQQKRLYFRTSLFDQKMLPCPNQHKSRSLLNRCECVSVKHSTVKNAPGGTGGLQTLGEERSEWYDATLV